MSALFASGALTRCRVLAFFAVAAFPEGAAPPELIMGFTLMRFSSALNCRTCFIRPLISMSIRVSRSPPTSPAAKEKSASGVPDASAPKAGGPSEDVDHAALARIREETRSSLRGDADARDASMASEAEARREKLAGLYERLGAFSPSPKTE